MRHPSRFAFLSSVTILLSLLALIGLSGYSAQALGGPLAQLAQSATATPAATLAAAPLKPGDKLGNMTLTALKSGDEITSGLPELANFCAYHSQPTDKTYHPGVFPAKCVIGPLAALVIGPSWFVYDKALLDKNWAGLNYELSVDGQPVDLKTFGTVEISTRNGKGIRRIWGVVLNHLTMGQHTIRQVWNQPQPMFDGQYNNEPGLYDFTYAVTVHKCPVQLPGASAAPTASATVAATGTGPTINLRPADYGIVAGALDECGARIFEVAAGSAADKAGLHADDVVVAVNGTQLTSRLQALALLSAALASKTGVTLTVERDGTFVDIAWQATGK